MKYRFIISLLTAAGFCFSFSAGTNHTSAPAVKEQYPVAPSQKILLDTGGVRTTVILSNLSVPWEIAWGPDNCIWYTEQDGKVSRVNPVTRQKKLLLTIPDVYRKRLGMLSMALHPDMKNSPYVFLNYTYLKPDSVIRSKLVRYTYTNDTLTGPVILLDIPANTGHNGSRIAIAPDGKLMMATGDTDMNNDAANGGNAQNINTPGGKILRLNQDGTIPDDNPFPGNPLWALGFRVPQGLVFGRHGRLYSGEHGNDNDDEINLIRKGGNYGYPYVLGKCDQPEELKYCATHDITPPIMAWTPTIAPSGIDYYGSTAIPGWTNSILVVTLKTQSLRVLQLNDSGTAVTGEKVYFEKAFGRLRDICVSPAGDVYISTSNRDWNPAPGFPHEDDDRIIRISPLAEKSSAGSAKPIKKPAGAIAKTAAPQKALAPGALVYNNYCSSCHKEGGAGLPGVFPALKTSAAVFGDKNGLIRKVMLGIASPAQSKEVYEQKMSPFNFLKDKELADVLTYIRRDFGKKAGAVSIADVTRIRGAKK